MAETGTATTSSAIRTNVVQEVKDLEKDLRSFVRVRNRLAQTTDDRLPAVLTNLLPRLLRRLDQVMLDLYDDSSSPSFCSPFQGGDDNPTTEAAPQHSKNLTPNIRLVLRQQMQMELTGTLSHATERVRGNRSMPVPWVLPVLQVLAPPLVSNSSNNNSNNNSNSLQSSVSQTMALALLQTGLPRYNDNNNNNNDNDSSSSDGSIGTLMPDLIACVDRLYQTVVVTTITVPPEETTETGKLHYKITGWLLLDAMAQTMGVKILQDWDMDHLDGTTDIVDWDELCCNNKEKKKKNATTAALPDAQQAVQRDGAGVMDLLLDVVLFWPRKPTTDLARWGQHGGRAAAEDEDAAAAADNSTGISRQGLARIHHRCRRTNNNNGGSSSSGSWNEAYLKQIKYAVLRYAIWPPAENGLFRLDATATNNNNEGATVSDRALLLAVLCATPNTMHGRLALSFVNHYKGAQKKLVHKVGGEGEKNWQTNNRTCTNNNHCSLALVCSFLILVLGDEAAQPILQEYAAVSHLWQGILGPRPTAVMFYRTPLPVPRAARAIDFICQYFRPNPEDVSSGTNAGIRLFVDLVVAIQDPQRHGVYWGIRLIQTLYQQIETNEQNKNQNKRQNEWTKALFQRCLRTAKAVLCTVPRANAIPETEPREQHGELPAGVPAPFGHRGDLNRLLANHRADQMKRRLRSEGAMGARETAYQMIAHLVAHEALLSDQSANDDNEPDNKKPFELAIILFQCAASEEEKMHTHVTRALDVLLTTYKKKRQQETKMAIDRSSPSATSMADVAPLLPSLLCAASADSTVSRLAVARWCSELLVEMDPGAAFHIGTYLADDPDPYVSAAARKTIPKSKMMGTPVKKARIDPPVDFFNLQNDLELGQLHKDLELRVRDLSEKCAIPVAAARVVLQEFRYSIQEAFQSLQEEKEATLDHAGVLGHFLKGNVMDVDEKSDTRFACAICYDDFSEPEGYATSCDHRFCRPCWLSYLGATVEEGTNNLLKATCPDHECRERLGPEDYEAIQPELVPKCKDALLANFVELDVLHRQCPGPDCTVVVRSTEMSSQSVTCTRCQTPFCFQCGGLPHKPANCTDFEHWNRIFGSSDFWVKKNSKPCPSCNVPIEKNQGCNHMKCTRCGADFCWLCLGVLYRHLEAHTCNRFDPTTNADNDEQRRALFFTERYQAHDDAELFVKDRVKSMEENSEKLCEKFWFIQEDGLESLWEACLALKSARNFLKYSYVAAWAKRHDEDKRDVFESHQATLELVTERLSQMTMSNFDQLYSLQGERGVRMFFRAMAFHTSSVVKYMDRLESMERNGLSG